MWYYALLPLCLLCLTSRGSIAINVCAVLFLFSSLLISLWIAPGSGLDQSETIAKRHFKPWTLSVRAPSKLHFLSPAAKAQRRSEHQLSSLTFLQKVTNQAMHSEKWTANCTLPTQYFLHWPPWHPTRWFSLLQASCVWAILWLREFKLPIVWISKPHCPSPKGRHPKKKIILNGHCPFSSDPPPSPKRARWSFFRPSKTTF